MTASLILTLLVVGLGIGFTNGFFGVGGCFLMVPTMFLVFRGLGVPTDTAMKVGLCTNMAVVVPTAFSGAFRHARKVKFSWGHYRHFAIPVAIGSLVGSGIAVFVPGQILKVLFGVLCFIGAWRFVTAKPKTVEEMPAVRQTRFWGAASIAGFIAHFLGIGRGLVYVPALNTILDVPTRQAVGLSNATMVVSSSVGALTLFVLGFVRHVADQPVWSLSYFNLAAWFFLVATSIPLAQLCYREPSSGTATAEDPFRLTVHLCGVETGGRLHLAWAASVI